MLDMSSLKGAVILPGFKTFKLNLAYRISQRDASFFPQDTFLFIYRAPTQTYTLPIHTLDTKRGRQEAPSRKTGKM